MTVDPEAVPVRDASTVVLLRDGAAGIEVWLLTRVAAMMFAAGASVFPGGRVEDADADLPITGDVAALAAALGCDERTARALLGGAVRETFEETGVLLGSPMLDLRASRAAVETGELPFGELLRAHGVTIDAATIVPWARWITPRGEPRRYDTRFFVAALPDGAEAADVTTESSAADWLPIGEALAQAQREQRWLMPPTASTLVSLRGFATVADALVAAAERDLAPISPTLTRGEDGAVVITLPTGESFTLKRPKRG